MIALAHHWLVTYRGGEKVLEQWRCLFPDAPISTLIHVPGDIPPAVEGKRILTSPLQNLPKFLRRRYKMLFPLHAWAFRRMRVPVEARFVLSSDASMAKVLRVPDGAIHVCYCHSPPRYLWDMVGEYSAGMNPVTRFVFERAIASARLCDYDGARRVDLFVANSKFVAGRIKRFYGRDSVVVYPPVDVHSFDHTRGREDFYLVVSQLVPYKRVDLAVEACNRLQKKLVVIGEGSEAKRIQAIAGPTVQLLGRQPFSVVKDNLERCRAFLYPQVEDFGITAVEAQAAGAPVIALANGGALETVADGVTGIHFQTQDVESLCDAITRLETGKSALSSEECRSNALRFAASRFRSEMKDLLQSRYPAVFRDYKWPDDVSKRSCS